MHQILSIFVLVLLFSLVEYQKFADFVARAFALRFMIFRFGARSRFLAPERTIFRPRVIFPPRINFRPRVIFRPGVDFLAFAEPDFLPADALARFPTDRVRGLSCAVFFFRGLGAIFLLPTELEVFFETDRLRFTPTGFLLAGEF